MGNANSGNSGPHRTPTYLRVARVLDAEQMTIPEIAERLGIRTNTAQMSIRYLVGLGFVRFTATGRLAKQRERIGLAVPLATVEQSDYRRADGGKAVAHIASLPLLEQAWPSRVARQVADIGVAGG